jgi:hypothetical protein
MFIIIAYLLKQFFNKVCVNLISDYIILIISYLYEKQCLKPGLLLQYKLRTSIKILLLWPPIVFHTLSIASKFVFFSA